MKLLLAIVILVLFAGGFYFFPVQPEEDVGNQVQTEETAVEESNEQEIVVEPEESQNQSEEPAITEIQPEAEVITVDTDVLSDEQQDLLQTFGIDTDAIEVTADMIVCAEEKIGKERLDAITAGDLPTFFEGLSLASCY